VCYSFKDLISHFKPSLGRAITKIGISNLEILLQKQEFHWLGPNILLLLALLIASFLRLWQLDSLPPGFNFDEAGSGVAAQEVAQGTFKLMWSIGGGKEPLLPYLTQPLFWLWGQTPLAVRLYAALWGIASVAALYFWAYHLFASDSPQSQAEARWLAGIAALGLATAFWHVAFSRIGFRALALPGLTAWMLGHLWLGLRRATWRNFLWTGGLLGLLMYSYLAARLVPLVLLLFFLLEALTARFDRRESLLRQYWRQLTALVTLAALIALPLGLYFIFNPGTFSARADAVSIFSPAIHQDNFWGLLWRTTTTTFGTFLSLRGDPNDIANIPGRPQLGLPLAGFFLIGLALSLYRWRKPAYLLPLTLWLVMLLPAILAPEGAPHHLRLIGTAPATYLFVALGFTQTMMFLRQRLRGWRSVVSSRVFGWGLILLVFGWTGYQTYTDYFRRWATEIDHYRTFDIYAVELVAQMSAITDPDAVYLIPMDLRAADEARHYTIDFLYHGQTPFYYLRVDEGTLAQQLTAAIQGRQQLAVVRWQQDKHSAADEKALVSFLLAIADAEPNGQAIYPFYTIDSYHLPLPQPEFAFPPIVTPIAVTLDNLIQVRRAEVLPNLVAGPAVAVAVTYARIAPTQVNYKASLRLVGPDGAVVAQIDRTLRHNWHQGTSLWPPEEVNEYYLLPLPPQAPPGDYAVQLVIYHPDTLAPLTDNGLVEVPLGHLAVTP
jgi:4-amino-4-deoxy-L-arabinose transferase-like glycosyltransferase